MQRVSVSSDLGQAIVFVTPLGDASKAKESVGALQRAASFVRRELAARIRVYRIPRIRFQLDPEMLTAEAMTLRRNPDETQDDAEQPLATQPGDGV